VDRGKARLRHQFSGQSVVGTGRNHRCIGTKQATQSRRTTHRTLPCYLSFYGIFTLLAGTAAGYSIAATPEELRMSDLPKFVQINEEGPREGFQFEKGPISTDRKVELIDALSETGLNHIQVASFVNPNRVPGWADADEVVKRFERKPGIHYTALWLNQKGLQRALATRRLDIEGSFSLTASATFLARNQQRSMEDN